MGPWQRFLASMGLGQRSVEPIGNTPPPAPAPMPAPATPQPPTPQKVQTPPPPLGSHEPQLASVGTFDYQGNLEEFFGKPVQDYESKGDIDDFASVAPRIQVEYDGEEDLAVIAGRLLDEPGIEACEALVIGAWNREHDDTPQSVIDLLITRRERLPALRAIFFGDISSEQNEMSWIMQGDYSRFWAAFPALQVFQARGGQSLTLGAIDHPSLHTLTLQTGGMPVELAREALAAKAPLTRLELWLGDDGYGCSTTPADLKPLFDGGLFPRLSYLGLCNSVQQDDIAVAVAASALLPRLKTLDLSKGVLTDKGGAALLASPAVAALSYLIVAHHYMSKGMVAALSTIGTRVVQSTADPLEPDEYGDDIYYNIAVAE